MQLQESADEDSTKDELVDHGPRITNASLLHHYVFATEFNLVCVLYL